MYIDSSRLTRTQSPKVYEKSTENLSLPPGSAHAPTSLPVFEINKTPGQLAHNFSRVKLDERTDRDRQTDKERQTDRQTEITSILISDSVN